eukprot:4599253-Alexandrium_andersonii.AAC.1
MDAPAHRSVGSCKDDPSSTPVDENELPAAISAGKGGGPPGPQPSAQFLGSNATFGPQRGDIHERLTVTRATHT